MNSALMEPLIAEALGHSLPPAIADNDLEQRVRAAVAASGRKVVALDDDPTGVQTVHDVAVLAHWSPEALAGELARPEPLFFVLTNSRGMPEAEARRVNEEIARNLATASEMTGVPFAIVSRSDSTLRGHFPAETDALAATLGGVDGVIICPAFFEGGRVTAGDVHFVREGERVVPAAETEFARDATFGYRARTLPEWVAEKSGGRISAADVASLSLAEIREGGSEVVAARLRAVRGGQPVVVNALDYPDLWTVVLGLMQAEAEGKRFLYRTGASFVRARAGITARPLLTRGELLEDGGSGAARGVVIVGSHVRRTSEQLARLLELPIAVGVEVSVPALLSGCEGREGEVARACREAEMVLASGRTPVVYTSRQIATATRHG